MKDRYAVHSAVKSALLIALIIISSYIYIPLPVSVISFQTVFINLTALLLPPSGAFLTVGIWLLMGAVGLPVFSTGTGVGVLFGLTGGFYWGFLLAAPFMSRLKGTEPDFKRYLASVSAGLIIEHICAVAVMSLHNGYQLISAFTSVSLPFIAGDAVKCVLSAFIGVKLVSALKNIK